MYRLTILLFLLLAGRANVSAQEYSYEYLLGQVLSFKTSSVESAKLKYLASEAEIVSNDFGLAFTSSVQHRFGEGFIEEDLTENNGQTFYRAGLRWDLLKDGWFQNRNTAGRLKIEAQLESLSLEEKQKAKSYYAQYAFTAYLFEKHLLKLYNQRFEQLKMKRPLFSTLKKQGYFTNEEGMDLDARIKEVTLQMDVLRSSTEAFELIFINEEQEPVFTFSKANSTHEMPEVEIYRLLNDLQESPALTLGREFNKQLVDRPNFWKDEVQLSARLDYNHQVSFSNDRRDFVSAGLSLSIPLTRNSSHKKRSYQAEQKIFDEQYELELSNRKKELLMLYQEYAFKKKQRKNLMSKYDQVKESIRVLHLHKSSMNTDMPITDASLLHDNLALVEIELVGLSKQMTQLLLKMNLLLPDYSISNYLRFKNDELIITKKGD